MSTLIAYATKYGCTEKCASMLAKKLTGKVDLLNLKEGKSLDLSHYDKVIIGGSVYIGKIQKEAAEFCTKNLDELKNKKIGLFICGMQEKDAIDTELNASFPEELLSIASAKGYFGGEFIFKKLNFFERLVVKKISKIDKDISNILTENIDNFAKLMNNA